MSLISRIIEHPLAYRLWQAPFAERKTAPVHEHCRITEVRRDIDRHRAAAERDAEEIAERPQTPGGT